MRAFLILALLFGFVLAEPTPYDDDAYAKAKKQMDAKYKDKQKLQEPKAWKELEPLCNGGFAPACNYSALYYLLGNNTIRAKEMLRYSIRHSKEENYREFAKFFYHLANKIEKNRVNDVPAFLNEEFVDSYNSCKDQSTRHYCSSAFILNDILKTFYTKPDIWKKRYNAALQKYFGDTISF